MMFWDTDQTLVYLDNNADEICTALVIVVIICPFLMMMMHICFQMCLKKCKKRSSKYDLLVEEEEFSALLLLK